MINFVAMKLTVVIPVYRVEATLDRCVESVLIQDIDDMEVILVDDGSPDSCPKMCDEWAEKDSRISVIHKENGGLSEARNAALDIAKGDYVTFVDSDDWLDEGTYKAILNLMDDNDIVEYPVAHRLSLSDRSYENMDDYWLKEQAYTHTFAWNKVYRRTLFNGIRYPKGKVFEDVYTLPLLLRKAKRISTTSQGCYHYEWNPAGITATADGEKLAMLLEAHLTSGMPIDDSYYMYLVNIQMDVWEQTSAPIILPKRKVNTRVLNNKQRIKAIFLNILSINILCIINKLIHRFKKPSRW
jgi:glycosyltransferase involved in cell wall biosynthesis